MVNFNLPNESFAYAHAAQQEAQHAGILANHGVRHKLAYYDKERILRKWQEYMVNAPVVLHNTLFFFFMAADVIISWDMIKELIIAGGIFASGRVPWWAIALLCLLINGWAIVTAHFIGKGWSKEIQDWERWNYSFIKRQNDTPINVLNGIMDTEFRRAKILAIISGSVLLIVVSLIVYSRYLMIEIVYDGSQGVFAILMIVLPIAIIIGEFFTGDYIWYSIKWLQNKIIRNRERKKFLSLKVECGKADQLAVQYASQAIQRKEHIMIVGDLEHAHMRMKHRSQQDDSYMDPFDKWRKIGFTFRGRKEQNPIINKSVFGILPNGAKTGDYLTDSDGKTTLYWDGDFDRLISVKIGTFEYLGPFQANAEHYIDLPEEGAESNGNGQGVHESVVEN